MTAFRFSNKELQKIKNILDFIELVEKNFKRIIDVNKTDKIEIVFIEKMD